MGTVRDRASRAQKTCGSLYNSLRCWMEEFCNMKREKGKSSESSIDCLLSEVGWAGWQTCPVSPLSQLVLNI